MCVLWDNTCKAFRTKDVKFFKNSFSFVFILQKMTLLFTKGITVFVVTGLRAVLLLEAIVLNSFKVCLSLNLE